MSPFIEIDDPTDERLGDYAALNDPALRKRYENQLGVFIAEGPNVVRQLLCSPYPTRSILLAREQLETFGPEVAELSVPVYVVERESLYELVRFRLHQGVLGCGGRLPPPALDDVLADATTVAVLEGLNDHENLGTLFRSARGLGVDAVLLAPGCADPLYRRCVRVSMGHVLHLPFAPVPRLEDALPLLHDRGFTTVALTPRDDAVDVAALGRPGKRVAALLGAEGPGLTAAAIEGATLAARIPLRPAVDSLNVAAAGAIAFHALTVVAPGRDRAGPAERVPSAAS